MRLLILVAIAVLPLSAQVTLDPPSVTIDNTDARALLLRVRTNFADEADLDEDGIVRAIEAKTWIERKATETIRTLVRDAREQIAEQNPEELDATRRQIRDDFFAARDAYRQMLRGENP